MDAASEGNGICFPYDVLLDILRRLPGGAIAACQFVCCAWRAIVDAHQLSLERYFPQRRAFPGIFVSKTECRSDLQLLRPTWPPAPLLPSQDRGEAVLQRAPPRVGLGRVLRAQPSDGPIRSPATRDAVEHGLDVPRLRPGSVATLSCVFLFQKGILPKEIKLVVPLLVYSSRTGQWENRAFAPGPCAPGSLYDLVARSPSDEVDGAFWSSQYWHGSLYVH
jgi:hypothetical protein